MNKAMKIFGRKDLLLSATSSPGLFRFFYIFEP